MTYLSELHPEVFFAMPRPGGIVVIDEEEEAKLDKGSKSTLRSSRSSRSKMSRRSSSGRRSIFDAILSATPEYVSREHRIKYAMDMSPWVIFDEDIDIVKPPNPLQDSIDILSIVITTVMLLAAKHDDISKLHLKWTLSYLENTRDEFGNYPPNIRGIMNHIKNLDPEIVSFNEDAFEADEQADTQADEEADEEPAEEAPPDPPEEQ